jgi:capsular polysaccharide biosynthesis protein
MTMTAVCAPETTQPATPANRAGALRSAARAFVRHRALFAATAGLVLFTTFIVTLSITPAYKSESTLLLHNPAPGAFGSLENILRSREVAESLVDAEWTKTPLTQHTGAEIRQHERALAAFARRLEVSPSAGTDTLHVAYVAETPTQAADVLGQLIEESTARLKLTEPAAPRQPLQPPAPAPPAPAPPAPAQPVQHDPVSTEALRSRIAGLDQARRAAEAQLAETATRVAAQKHDLAILSPWTLGDVNPAYTQGKLKLVAGIAQLGALRSRIAGLSTQREQLARQLADTRTTASPAPVEVARTAAAPVEVLPPAEELVVIQRPTMPVRPIRPRPAFNFMVGLVAAGLLGLCAVAFAEVRAKIPAQRRPEEVATMPLLATIPHAAPHVPRTFGALALSPAFHFNPEREEPEPESAPGLFSVAPAQPLLALPTPTPRLVLEPLEPAPRLPARGLGNAPLPARSRLTPSQRAQLRRSAPVPDPEGRGYVTYTFNAQP